MSSGIEALLSFPEVILENFSFAWGFSLLLVRFGALMMFLPGIGGGIKGSMNRKTGVMLLAFVALLQSPEVRLPSSLLEGSAMMFSEAVLGAVIGFIPYVVISGVQTGAQVTAGSMGLSASQLIDPTSGTSMSPLARIFGDLTVLCFLTLDGHHILLYAASGLGGSLVPGEFLVGSGTLDHLVMQSGEIFNVAVMISAPAICALLITQFVMGIISRAVQQVNIFIISFPITIVLGLVVMLLSLPAVMTYSVDQFRHSEKRLNSVLADTIKQ